MVLCSSSLGALTNLRRPYSLFLEAFHEASTYQLRVKILPLKRIFSLPEKLCGVVLCVLLIGVLKQLTC